MNFLTYPQYQWLLSRFGVGWGAGFLSASPASTHLFLASIQRLQDKGVRESPWFLLLTYIFCFTLNKSQGYEWFSCLFLPNKLILLWGPDFTWVFPAHPQAKPTQHTCAVEWSSFRTPPMRSSFLVSIPSRLMLWEGEIVHVSCLSFEGLINHWNLAHLWNLNSLT